MAGGRLIGILPGGVPSRTGGDDSDGLPETLSRIAAGGCRAISAAWHGWAGAAADISAPAGGGTDGAGLLSLRAGNRRQ